MANKNILDIPVGVLESESYLYAQTGTEFVRVPASDILDALPDTPGGVVGDNYVFVDDESGDSDNDVPEAGLEPSLNADLLGGHKPEDFLMTNGIMRRNYYRGENLGSYLSDAQKAAIADGSFSMFYIGDYWEKNGIKWRIADMDYWINSGDTACTTHHLVIVPDQYIITAPMNDTNITTGGYPGSKMCQETMMSSVYPHANAMFENASFLNHRELYASTITNGRPTSGNWYDEIITLLNEPMVYGSYIFTPANDGVNIPYIYTIDKTQLALFRMNPTMINPGRYSYWLRDVVSASYFALVGVNGCCNCYGASYSGMGVRPVFGIRG